MVAAGDRDAPEAREALAALCDAYWYPIYAYVRRQGHNPERAQDLTQDFFAYVLEQRPDRQGRPRPGPFPCVPADRLRPATSPLSATGRTPASAEEAGPPFRSTASSAEGRYAREPAHELTPERIFDRSWALTLLGRVFDQLRREYDDAGRAATFDELRAVLTERPGIGLLRDDRRAAGTSEGAVRVAVHRLRRRYGILLRQEIAATVDDPTRWTTRSGPCSRRWRSSKIPVLR